MCELIVVAAGRNRSTNLGRDADIWSLPGYHHDYLKFYQLPNSNLFTHRMLFFWREATSEIYAPRGLFFIIFAFAIYFSLLLFLDILIQNTKIPCCKLLLFILSRVPARSIYPIYYNFIYLFTHEGLTTPLLCRVASICSLCAGAVYVGLRGSPTSSITLVSSLREIPTIVVLHHPFHFGEILT